jgi:hypothetical protein
MITSMFTLLDLNIRKKIAPLNTQKGDRPSTKIKQRSPLNTSSRNDRPLNISTLRSPLQKNQTAIALSPAKNHDHLSIKNKQRSRIV